MMPKTQYMYNIKHIDYFYSGRAGYSGAYRSVDDVN